LATGKEIRLFRGEVGPISAVAFAPDGKTLASVGSTTAALLWDVSGLNSRPPAVNRKPAELDVLWQRLADADAVKAYQAVQDWIATGDQAVLYLRVRLKPAELLDARRLRRLIEDLNSPKFMVRQQAEQDLEKLGELAGPALKEEPPVKRSL